jgi:exosortase C (VPDSG-CTERM-specific)
MQPPPSSINNPGHSLPSSSGAPGSPAPPVSASPAPRPRLLWFLIFVAVVAAAFSRQLISLAVYTAGSELDSYILLVPLISAYLLHLQRHSLLAARDASPGWACIPAAFGFAALGAARHWGQVFSQNDALSLSTFAFVSFVFAGGFLFLGRKAMAAVAFPIGFLIFLVPLPDAAVNFLETASKLGSTEVTAFFFDLFGVPAFRQGTYFQLPGISIRVAQECSGIHSSWILLIASLIACHLILRTFWRRAVLIVFAILLGVVRNGFRILVLGWLCVHVGPQILDTPIHHKGGPIFFILSLIPLFLLLWTLCKGERKNASDAAPGSVIPPGLAPSGPRPLSP